ncbi:hypothetical protein MBEHAL_2297 [Halarchaeum acidiphilum MH1-52-1]|uniref:DUF192 domain-containing protein n=1 Tax=Halarchaeum acidiphilum MH1-52-1 TaxID=1261545 RepID=U2YXL4_9EURY|nr:DUF192 domain-containing protein [Halarchaeum acidiphilum]GAD53537.1 hypothetical protein MBEHAL_2297 [Halarchaeum acidiphilum MH1-52-1]
MDARTRRLTTGVALLLAVALVAVGAWAFTGSTGHEHATVTVSEANGTTIGVVHARVADSATERYRGLSGTESLANGTGMWFVYESEGARAYVMRDMRYPLDMVFVGSDGRITKIHHAPTEEPPYREYTGRARWVLEVPYGWTTRHGIDAGDRVTIEYGRGGDVGS